MASIQGAELGRVLVGSAEARSSEDFPMPVISEILITLRPPPGKREMPITTATQLVF
jgi:hypothetical protein